MKQHSNSSVKLLAFGQGVRSVLCCAVLCCAVLCRRPSCNEIGKTFAKNSLLAKFQSIEISLFNLITKMSL